MTPMALGLFRHGRIGLLPVQIKNKKQLAAILARAEEIETGQ
jgi:hypothetical protein